MELSVLGVCVYEQTPNTLENISDVAALANLLKARSALSCCGMFST
jgi:hypothetical protein